MGCMSFLLMHARTYICTYVRTCITDCNFQVHHFTGLRQLLLLLCLQDEEPEAGGSAGHSELDPNSDDDIEEGEDEEGVKDIVICQFDKVRAVRLGEAAGRDLT